MCSAGAVQVDHLPTGRARESAAVMDEKTTGAGEFACLLGNLPYRDCLAGQVGPGQLERLRGVRLVDVDVDVDDGRL